MRVLLDTNVIVSAVTTRGLCADVFRVVLSEHDLVTCSKVLHEVRRILRNKFAVPEEVISEYLELISQDAIMVEPKDLPGIRIKVKDKDDVEIVAAAVAGNVQVLATGDAELQGIKTIQTVRVLSPRAFWQELKAQQGDAPDGH
jgi:putative PIN family toxin of toxin-antitoxin system